MVEQGDKGLLMLGIKRESTLLNLFNFLCHHIQPFLIRIKYSFKKVELGQFLRGLREGGQGGDWEGVGLEGDLCGFYCMVAGL